MNLVPIPVGFEFFVVVVAVAGVVNIEFKSKWIKKMWRKINIGL